MRVVLDSNILFSALIKDSTTRKKILEYEGHFLFPEFIFQELEAHKEELREKSGMSIEEFYMLLELMLRKVEIVPTTKLLPHRKKALEIVKEIDVNDALFIACALAYPESIIWSDDKKLKSQKKVRVCNTKEMLKILV